MYKITYLPTGNIFYLPEVTAQELKDKYPDEYKILEKNGKKYNDKITVKKENNTKSIYSKVVQK